MAWNNPLIYIAAAAFLYGVRGLLAIGDWKGRTDSSVNTIKEAVDEIRDDIKKIFRRFPDPATHFQNPLRLSELGVTISTEIGAGDWLHDRVQEIVENTLVHDDSPYGIQDFAFDYVRIRAGNLPDSLVDKMKGSASIHGIDISSAENVLAICLRDELLAIYHPELLGMPDDSPTQ